MSFFKNISFYFSLPSLGYVLFYIPCLVCKHHTKTLRVLAYTTYPLPKFFKSFLYSNGM